MCTIGTRERLSPIVEVNEVLILKAQQGDQEAFSAIVEECWTPLVRFARSIVGDADAEDIVQEALLIAWRKLPGLKIRPAFASWLYRIALRVSLRRIRSRPRLAPLTLAHDRATGGRAAEEIDVERVLAALPPRQRAVMHLTLIEGMSDSEIGAVLAIEPASVRSHRRRARETLRRLLTVSKQYEGALHEVTGTSRS
jgi:RNA polymerase sigma-70 factor (ECF subfamily)